MADKELAAGLTAECCETVTYEKTALAVGSGDQRGYATPMMIALIDKTAVQALERALEESFTSVGTLLNVKHLSATPIGMEVRARATLSEVDKKRLVFSVEAYDETGIIGEGVHERFIVDKERFMARAQGKLTK